MTVFYFTATGNSFFVAKTIGGNLYSIPQLMRNEQFNFEDNVIGFVFPIYGFGPPKMVKEFFKNIKFKSEYTFAVGTYGNMHGSCMFNLARTFKKNGVNLNYADTILMVDNYLPGFEINSQIEKLPEKRVDEQLKIIVNNIANKVNSIQNAAFAERALTAFVQPITSKLLDGKTAQKYIVDEKCGKCGICSKVCPTGNIEIKDKIIFGNVCEVCYGCVHICPKNAIHLKNEQSNIRFRNENVTLQEIIQANCQK
jgi:ferredoxin/flavodoxin